MNVYMTNAYEIVMEHGRSKLFLDYNPDYGIFSVKGNTARRWGGEINVKLVGLSLSTLVSSLFEYVDMHEDRERLNKKRGIKPFSSTYTFIPPEINFWFEKRFKEKMRRALYWHWVEITQDTDMPKKLWNRLYSLFGKVSVRAGTVVNLINMCRSDHYLYSDIMSSRLAAGLAISYMAYDGMTCDGLNNMARYQTLPRSLRRSKVPGGINLETFRNVVNNYSDLRRPINTRHEWIIYSLISNPYYRMCANKINAFWRSSPDDIIKSYRILAEFYQYPIKRPKLVHLANVYRDMIFDLPEDYVNNRMSLIGLARQSLDYHRDFQNGYAHTYVAKEEYRNRPFVKPPIELPQDSRIRFIDNYNDLIKEGKIMGHCVASYAGNCINGESYIFSFADKKLGRATIEVDPHGNVIQSRGVGNSSNKATKISARILKQWGKNFMDAESKSVENKCQQGIVYHPVFIDGVEEEVGF